MPVLLLAALAIPGNTLANEPPPLPRIGTIEHPALAEASGLARSRRQPGVFWCVTDSGGPPRLFALAESGRLLAEFEVQEAVNLDWESLAADDAGNLYIGDVGNNTVPGGLAARWIYRVREPDVDRQGPVPAEVVLQQLAVDRTYGYAFPQKPFDVEGLFVHGGCAYLIEKTRSDTARVYRLPLADDAKQVAAKPVALEPCGELKGAAQVTGADLSADGRRLAVCSYRYAALYEVADDRPLAELLRAEPAVVRFPSSAVEGCAWDGWRLILVSEHREMFEVQF